MARAPSLTYAPRLLPAPRAAEYLGVSETKLRTLGIPRKILHGKRVYDRLDLDAFADTLMSEDEAGAPNSCDEVFGL